MKKTVLLVFLVFSCICVSFRAEGASPTPEQLYENGRRYEYGKGVSKNDSKALSFYLKAAEAGHVEAQARTGLFYAFGRRTGENVKKALFWYEKAARQGHYGAQNNLANILWTGPKGVKKDREKALDFWFLSAMHGYGEAQLKMALFYLSRGEQDPAAYRKAYYWNFQAALQGLPEAQWWLGMLREAGKGVEKDMKTAVHWYKKAAANGHREAKARLKKLGY